MSDTDKTKPYWIQALQNSKDREEVHVHYNGVCELEEPNISDLKFSYRRVHCQWKVNWSYRRFCGRRGWFHSYVDEQNGSQRAKVRMLRREVIKMDRDDIEDIDFQNFPHRHSAIWDSF